MISIELASTQPTENAETWSFSVDELEYLLQEHANEAFYYYKGRLYEKCGQN